MARYVRPVLNFNADDVWAAACAAQRINGEYVKYQIDERKTNRSMVESFLAEPALLSEVDREQGKAVRTYYKGFTFKILAGVKLNEFDNTAMTISNRDVIESTYDLAVIASLPSCYERSVKRDTLNKRINGASGGFVASAGSKVRVNIEVIKCIFSQNFQCYFVTGITEQDQAVFFSQRNPLEVGKTFEVAGTVKAHRDNSTQLTRAKVI